MEDASVLAAITSPAAPADDPNKIGNVTSRAADEPKKSLANQQHQNHGQSNNTHLLSKTTTQSKTRLFDTSGGAIEGNTASATGGAGAGTGAGSGALRAKSPTIATKTTNYMKNNSGSGKYDITAASNSATKTTKTSAVWQKTKKATADLDRATVDDEQEEPRGTKPSKNFKKQLSTSNEDEEEETLITEHDNQNNNGDNNNNCIMIATEANNTTSEKEQESQQPQAEQELAVAAPRMTINLKECRYNLFQELSIKEFSWRVILNGDHVVTPANYAQYVDLQKRIKQFEEENAPASQQQQQEISETSSTSPLKAATNTGKFQQRHEEVSEPNSAIMTTRTVVHHHHEHQASELLTESALATETNSVIQEGNEEEEDAGSEEDADSDKDGGADGEKSSPTLTATRSGAKNQQQESSAVEESRHSGLTELPVVERTHSLRGHSGMIIGASKLDSTKSPTTVDRRGARFQHGSTNISRFSNEEPSSATSVGGASSGLPQLIPAPEQETSIQLQDEELVQELESFIPENEKELNWDICWQDHGITPEFLSQLKPYQRVNHFLGMYNIARKNTLSIHLKRFEKEFPDYYRFFPQTWLYPQDLHEISEYNAKRLAKRKQKLAKGLITRAEAEEEPPVIFISKPEAGCQGRGIFISNNFEEMKEKIDANNKKHEEEYKEYLRQEEENDTAEVYSKDNTVAESNIMSVLNEPPQENEEQDNLKFEKSQASYVIEKYLNWPALWKGHKYDFRIYVLVTSVIDPMTIYLYKDGLVRLASEKYDPTKNFSDLYTHLTNYSLNKKNDKFDNDEHKLRLNDCLKGIMTEPPVKKGKPGATKPASEIWDEIEAIVVKTIITVEPELEHIYRSCQTKEPECCFELLGFDIMLDQKLKPWMLEVNHTPSFGADTAVDESVKRGLLKNTLEIIEMSVEHRKRVENELKQEMKQQIEENNYKRLTVLEHSQRVRFDHEEVEARLGRSNKFKLIYPMPAPGSDPDLYNKFERKAAELWKSATGTHININARRDLALLKEKEKEEKPKKPKKKKKKALPKETIEPSSTKNVSDNEGAAIDVNTYDALKEKSSELGASKNMTNNKGSASLNRDNNEKSKQEGVTSDTGVAISRNNIRDMKRETGNKLVSQAIDSASAGKAQNSSNNEALQYNFIDAPKNSGCSPSKQPTLYQSMTKTLKSDKDGRDGVGFDVTNPITFDLLLEGNNTGADNMKGRSEEKPQRHLSALHQASSGMLEHTPQCIASGSNCHLRQGGMLASNHHPSAENNNAAPGRKNAAGGISGVNQISHANSGAEQHQNGASKMITPCMEALHAAASSQFFMSPNGTHIHVVNQISHGHVIKGSTIHNSYNNTASSGFTPNKNAAGSIQGYINNNSFNSAQEPTQSSKAKQVNPQQNNTEINWSRLKEESAYTLQEEQAAEHEFLLFEQEIAQQYPFPIETYTRQELEKMGIPSSTFHNLPLMSQGDIQKYLKEQLRDEFLKQEQQMQIHHNKMKNQSNHHQGFYHEFNQNPLEKNSQEYNAEESSKIPELSSQFSQNNRVVANQTTTPHHASSKSSSLNVEMPSAASGAIHHAPALGSESAKAVASGKQEESSNGTQLTRKQREELEFLLAQGQLPQELMDDKNITDLFKTLTDENGSMWHRYKEYCRQLISKNQFNNDNPLIFSHINQQSNPPPQEHRELHREDSSNCGGAKSGGSQQYTSSFANKDGHESGGHTAASSSLYPNVHSVSQGATSKSNALNMLNAMELEQEEKQSSTTNDPSKLSNTNPFTLSGSKDGTSGGAISSFSSYLNARQYQMPKQPMGVGYVNGRQKEPASYMISMSEIGGDIRGSTRESNATSNAAAANILNHETLGTPGSTTSESLEHKLIMNSTIQEEPTQSTSEQQAQQSSNEKSYTFALVKGTELLPQALNTFSGNPTESEQLTPIMQHNGGGKAPITSSQQKTSSKTTSGSNKIPPSQMSMGEIEMANNQSVNSWFIQRLKSILQGNSNSSNGGAGDENHQGSSYINQQAAELKQQAGHRLHAIEPVIVGQGVESTQSQNEHQPTAGALSASHKINKYSQQPEQYLKESSVLRDGVTATAIGQGYPAYRQSSHHEESSTKPTAEQKQITSSSRHFLSTNMMNTNHEQNNEQAETTSSSFGINRDERNSHREQKTTNGWVQPPAGATQSDPANIVAAMIPPAEQQPSLAIKSVTLSSAASGDQSQQNQEISIVEQKEEKPKNGVSAAGDAATASSDSTLSRAATKMMLFKRHGNHLNRYAGAPGTTGTENSANPIASTETAAPGYQPSTANEAASILMRKESNTAPEYVQQMHNEREQDIINVNMAVGSTIGSSESVERSHNFNHEECNHHHEKVLKTTIGPKNEEAMTQLTTDKESLMADNGIFEFLKNGSTKAANLAKSNAVAIRQERANFLGQHGTPLEGGDESQLTHHHHMVELSETPGAGLPQQRMSEMEKRTHHNHASGSKPTSQSSFSAGTGTLFLFHY